MTLYDPNTCAADTAPLWAELERDWKGDERGIDRPAYADAETRAMEYFAREWIKMGGEVYCDLALNYHLVAPSKNRAAPVFMTGSHLDAVPRGGRFDGPAGIVAGFAAARHLYRTVGWDNLPQDVVITLWRGEESASHRQVSMGSGMALGVLNDNFLRAARRVESDETLMQAINAQGGDADALMAQIQKGALIDAFTIAAAVEAHIEQGPVLYHSGAKLGIVTSARGNVRVKQPIVFTGESAHSGTTPMELRRDAGAAIFELRKEMEKWGKRSKNAGHDIVWTWPFMEAGSKDTPTSVPDHGEIIFETRSTDQSILRRGRAALLRAVERTARKTNTQFILPPEMVTITDAVDFDGAVQQVINDAMLSFFGCAYTNKPPVILLPSGAGHDSVYLAKKGIPTAMIFMAHARNGISHNPAETLDMHELGLATGVLAKIMQQPFRARQGTPIGTPSFTQALMARGARQLKFAA